MAPHTRRRILAWLILAAQAVFWAFPSNVVRLIARDRDTLLGRYSIEKVSGGLLMLLVSLPLLAILFARPDKLKGRIFRVVALLIVLIPGLVVVDVIGRWARKSRYVADKGFMARPPGYSATLTFEDKPEAARTYPNVQPGYPPVSCKLTADSRGFRNPPGIERCDVLAIGDSFTEGSSVSDDQCWPVLLGKTTGRTVYNLGMSGANTQEYLLAYEKIGRGLKPGIVVCMVYEGNDFRGTNIDRDGDDATKTGGWRRVEKFFKASPLVARGRELLTRLLAPVNAHGPVRSGEILDWLPLAVPAEQPHAYAFQPKDLLALNVAPEAFARSRGWKDSAKALGLLAKACREDAAQLVVVLAPSKPHVILPLVRDRLPAEHVRAFAALEKSNLPPADTFVIELLGRLDVMEKQLETFCLAEGIGFVSLTAPLRERTAAGRQVYYSYDQHWTPDGHKAVASALAPRLFLFAASQPSE